MGVNTIVRKYRSAKDTPYLFASQSCFHLWPPLSSSSTLSYMPSSPPFLCRYVPLCACPAVSKGAFRKKNVWACPAHVCMPACVHASPMHASPLCTSHFCTCVLPRHFCATVCRYVHARLYQMGGSKMTPASGSSRPIVWPYLRITDGNEQKPTVTDSGFWRLCARRRGARW